VEKGLIADRKLRVEDGQVALTAHDPLAAMNDAQRMRLAEIAAWFTKAGMAPPDAAQFSDADDPDLVALLVASGTLVSLHNVALNQWVLFHAECVAQAVSRLRDIFPPPERFTTSQARSALTTTRKFIVPLLEHLDSLGITRRDGDTRQMNTQAH
jgi:selenocysteine-specific elongation factor